MNTRKVLIAAMWKSSFWVRAGAGVDQLADVGVARGDHAVERRINVLEGLQFLEALHVGCAEDASVAFLACEVAVGVVDVLLRYGVRVFEVLVALPGDLRQIAVGFRSIQIRASLQQLLIDFRRIDYGEQLTRFHAGADVVHTTF